MTADAIEVARLRPLTRQVGLSLADRACLALAHRLGTRALTADSAWSGLARPPDATDPVIALAGSSPRSFCMCSTAASVTSAS